MLLLVGKRIILDARKAREPCDKRGGAFFFLDNWLSAGTVVVVVLGVVRFTFNFLANFFKIRLRLEAGGARKSRSEPEAEAPEADVEAEDETLLS